MSYSDDDIDNAHGDIRVGDEIVGLLRGALAKAKKMAEDFHYASTSEMHELLSEVEGAINNVDGDLSLPLKPAQAVIDEGDGFSMAREHSTYRVINGRVA